MLPATNAISVGPRVLPVLLAVGGATAAGGYVRNQGRNLDRRYQYSTAQNGPLRVAPSEKSPPEPRSKSLDLVLESIFA
ncbi:hypothetical protein B0J13DRAFT_556093 [Dactylonectria estremocensis]|uniref:Uncharacterized protein n=1 Tax=Dactylonectria estremocensis TaxID=1079267 RepID=A0A9P9ERL0_9HYPO|nr:hypothetical protein B0J13DRAFT_556093 [Dactylonectria estremocensis]